MPVPTLKINYFDIRARGEPLRLACILGDLPFSDNRLAFSEFPAIRSKTPYLALPTLEIDGATYAQSAALLRYLGKLTSLYPECPLAALKIDEVVDVMEDLFQACFIYRGKDKDILRKGRQTLVEVQIPRYVGGLEKRLEVMGDGPWAVGEHISIADLIIANTVNNFKSGFFDFVDADALDGYPRVMASYRAVMKHPKVVEWYGKHPIPNVALPLTD